MPRCWNLTGLVPKYQWNSTSSIRQRRATQALELSNIGLQSEMIYICGNSLVDADHIRPNSIFRVRRSSRSTDARLDPTTWSGPP